MIGSFNILFKGRGGVILHIKTNYFRLSKTPYGSPSPVGKPPTVVLRLNECGVNASEWIPTADANIFTRMQELPAATYVH